MQISQFLLEEIINYKNVQINKENYEIIIRQTTK